MAKRNAILQKVSRSEKSICGKCCHRFVCRVVDNQPCFECNQFVEVVHGWWLPDMEEFDDDPVVGIRGGVYQTGWKCSICGRSEPAKEPFCNCGAKMDGERKDNA